MYLFVLELLRPEGDSMIARIWHGKTRAEDADAYLAFLRERATPDYQGTPGNRGVFLLHRIKGGEADFLTLTYWENVDAIRAFAGADIARAKYYPEDEGFLLELEPTVQHYDIEGEGGIGSFRLNPTA